MKGILISTNKKYKIINIKNISDLAYYLGGFIVCERLTIAYLENRVEKSVCMIRRELKLHRDHLKVNSYATSLINKKNSLEKFIMGNSFLIQQDSNGDYVDLEESNIFKLKKDLEINGYLEGEFD